MFPTRLSVVALLVMASAVAQVPERIAAEEVILDVVVRDKSGRAITDLRAADFRVSDGGAVQNLSGFRFVGGKDSIAGGSSGALDPLRQIRLVTLAFAPLDIEARRRARQAALDLIEAQQAQNVYYEVVAIGRGLSMLQPYTADRVALRRAVELATSGKDSQFAMETARFRAELQKLAEEPEAAAFEKGRDVASLVRPVLPGDPKALEKLLAKLNLRMMMSDAGSPEADLTRGTISAVSWLATSQRELPGRKTVVHFSEGMLLPTYLDVPFRSTIGRANSANLSVYTVDARGGSSDRQAATARYLNSIANEASIATTQTNGVDRPTPEQVKSADIAEAGMRANPQLALRDLAESTGGFFIGDTNDLRPALRKVQEEISSYYELAYRPQISSYDGSFRPVRVETVRKDLVVHARSGYFALPPSIRETALTSFEVPLLKALEATPLARDFEIRAGVVRLRPGKESIEASVLVEVPLAGVRFTEAGDKYTARISLVALLKNEQGEVVRKFMHDLPLAGPVSQLAALRQSNFIFKEALATPPGRYRLDVAVMDQEGGKMAARRVAYVAPSWSRGCALGSLVLVRGYQPDVKDLPAGEPFEYQGGRITPTLVGSVPNAAPGSQLALFISVFPDPAVAEIPTLTLEYSVNGKRMSRGDVQLPDPGPLKRIPYVMSMPVDGLPAGTYEIRAVARQGESVSEERIAVQVGAAH